MNSLGIVAPLLGTARGIIVYISSSVVFDGVLG